MCRRDWRWCMYGMRSVCGRWIAEVSQAKSIPKSSIQLNSDALLWKKPFHRHIQYTSTNSGPGLCVCVCVRSWDSFVYTLQAMGGENETYAGDISVHWERRMTRFMNKICAVPRWHDFRCDYCGIWQQHIRANIRRHSELHTRTTRQLTRGRECLFVCQTAK